MEDTIEKTIDVIYESCKRVSESRTRLVSVQANDIVAIIDHLRQQPAAKTPKEIKS